LSSLDRHPSAKAIALAKETQKDARFVELVLSESKRIVRHRENLESSPSTGFGFVMANAGIDHSKRRARRQAPSGPCCSGRPGPLGKRSSATS